MGKVLVTGGCGYIGSHTLVDLIENGHSVFSIDNLSNSSAKVLEGVKDITGVTVTNYEVDLCDLLATQKAMTEEGPIDAVVHFAAFKSVKESVEQPILYFKNNLNSLINLLFACETLNIPRFIFSSSCTVYGNPDTLPVTEETQLKPAESPYGKTKQLSEDLINHAATTGFLKAIHLRYFNPAGAHHSIKIGESPIIEAQNLIPVITETAIGKRESLTVYGSDYPTRDGTNIRDYIHIEDLAHAHTLALEYLDRMPENQNVDVFNLGIGKGVSVKEAIQAFEEVSARSLNYQFGPRRPGDVISIYADYNKAEQKLGWKPQRNIKDIMDSAWKWELKRRETAS